MRAHVPSHEGGRPNVGAAGFAPAGRKRGLCACALAYREDAR